MTHSVNQKTALCLSVPGSENGIITGVRSAVRLHPYVPDGCQGARMQDWNS